MIKKNHNDLVKTGQNQIEDEITFMRAQNNENDRLRKMERDRQYHEDEITQKYKIMGFVSLQIYH